MRGDKKVALGAIEIIGLRNIINPIIVYEKGGVTMKREYSTPAMKVEVFEASESVAACYKINCNTGKGILFKDRKGRVIDVHFSRLGTEDRFKNPNAS